MLFSLIGIKITRKYSFMSLSNVYPGKFCDFLSMFSVFKFLNDGNILDGALIRLWYINLWSIFTYSISNNAINFLSLSLSLYHFPVYRNLIYPNSHIVERPLYKSHCAYWLLTNTNLISLNSHIEEKPLYKSHCSLIIVKWKT